MNTFLWVLQILAGVAFALTGTVKVLAPRERLPTKMQWAKAWPRWRIKLLGLGEVAGAVGLVAPTATGIAPVLVPIAALCLVALMGGAIQTHLRLGEGIAPAAVIGVLCAVITLGRLL